MQLRAIGERAARAAGALLLDHATRGPVAVESKSSTTDMVSAADHASEELLVALLRAERPDDGLIGEEGASHTGTTGLTWVCDPLDGTTNYLYRLPQWAVSVAVEDDAGPVASCVYDPSHDELFSAARGHGAHRDGEPLRCSDKADLATALVGTGFSYQPGRRAEQGMVLTALLPRVRDVRRFGSAAADLCFVAGARLDVYYEAGLAPWDLAAGEIIAREAGATVTDLEGGPVQAGSVLACAPALHEPFLELLGALGPPD